MPLKMHRLGLSAALMFLMWGNSWAAPPLEQPPMTNYMRSVVGTRDELSPLVPAEATKVKKIGNQWTCEIKGQPMVYNEAAARWEPQPQKPQTK
ncbi:MAG: hypothetical protein M0P73_02240 [Syntrophobacterales bacterium]|jgi:hypothetical protein|nr:hypothetical protein [Syntrophobacterales bacterium]